MPFVRKRAPSVERSPHRKQGSKFFFAGKARRQATQELLDISKSRLNRLLPSHAKGATASETNLDLLSDAEVRELAAQISSRETSTEPPESTPGSSRMTTPAVDVDVIVPSPAVTRLPSSEVLQLESPAKEEIESPAKEELDAAIEEQTALFAEAEAAVALVEAEDAAMAAADAEAEAAKEAAADVVHRRRGALFVVIVLLCSGAFLVMPPSSSGVVGMPAPTEMNTRFGSPLAPAHSPPPNRRRPAANKVAATKKNKVKLGAIVAAPLNLVGAPLNFIINNAIKGFKGGYARIRNFKPKA